MIDRNARDRAAELLRRFAAGEVANGEMFRVWPESEDEGVTRVADAIMEQVSARTGDMFSEATAIFTMTGDEPLGVQTVSAVGLRVQLEPPLGQPDRLVHGDTGRLPLVDRHRRLPDAVGARADRIRDRGDPGAADQAGGAVARAARAGSQRRSVAICR